MRRRRFEAAIYCLERRSATTAAENNQWRSGGGMGIGHNQRMVVEDGYVYVVCGV